MSLNRLIFYNEQLGLQFPGAFTQGAQSKVKNKTYSVYNNEDVIVQG